MIRKYEIKFRDGTIEIRSFENVYAAIRFYGDFGEENIVKVEEIER